MRGTILRLLANSFALGLKIFSLPYKAISMSRPAHNYFATARVKASEEAQVMNKIPNVFQENNNVFAFLHTRQFARYGVYKYTYVVVNIIFT